jgi:cytochrome c
VSLDRHGFLMSLLGFVAVSLLVIAFYVVGVRAPEAARFTAVPGDPDAGRVALARMGCGACHQIDGIGVARGRVGPALNDLQAQRFIAGRLPHTPENLVRFIMDPQGVSPGSAMPNLDVVDVEAWNMVAYLYTLGPRR